MKIDQLEKNKIYRLNFSAKRWDKLTFLVLDINIDNKETLIKVISYNSSEDVDGTTSYIKDCFAISYQSEIGAVGEFEKIGDAKTHPEYFL